MVSLGAEPEIDEEKEGKEQSIATWIMTYIGSLSTAFNLGHKQNTHSSTNRFKVFDLRLLVRELDTWWIPQSPAGETASFDPVGFQHADFRPNFLVVVPLYNRKSDLSPRDRKAHWWAKSNKYHLNFNKY
jgi:hypothetical protein